MKALLVTIDTLGKYHIHGPLTSDEALSITREGIMVILLCDYKTSKSPQYKDDYTKFLECVSSSKLRCRKEHQIRTMEYFIGTELSYLVGMDAMPEPTIIFFDAMREIFLQGNKNESGSKEEVSTS